MEGDTRRRLLEEREQERKRREQRQDAERVELQDWQRERDMLRERLRTERESVHQQALRVRQERDEQRTRTAAEREAARELASQRVAERELELKRVQLDREARRRAAAGGNRPQVDEAYKSALEYDIYVRNSYGARESFIRQASATQRDQAEFVFRQVDAAAANDGKVSDPELLLHRLEQLRASMAKATQRPKPRIWLVLGLVSFLVLAALYLAF
ncbi:MAG TPA: hypothetical protein VJR89_28990 [Polyangiales bacterium]|nr:hypothetical protein [Polyangiales bacterium]